MVMVQNTLCIWQCNKSRDAFEDSFKEEKKKEEPIYVYSFIPKKLCTKRAMASIPTATIKKNSTKLLIINKQDNCRTRIQV